MTLHIDLSPQVSERLIAVARSRGIDPVALLEKMVTEHLPTEEWSAGLLSYPPPGRAAERLRKRLATEATDDPELIREAQESIDDMKRAMNAERRRAGAEPIF